MGRKNRHKTKGLKQSHKPAPAKREPLVFDNLEEVLKALARAHMYEKNKQWHSREYVLNSVAAFIIGQHNIIEGMTEMVSELASRSDEALRFAETVINEFMLNKNLPGIQGDTGAWKDGLAEIQEVRELLATVENQTDDESEDENE